MKNSDCIQRIRIWLSLFMLGLCLSGIAAFPLRTELEWLLWCLHRPWLAPASDWTHLLPWIERVNAAWQYTNDHYPFLQYGTDWLAFAHLMIAVAFIGPWIDPVRNKWVITFGLIACSGVVPLALIAGAMREIPLPWRFLDCSFGVLGAVPLLMCVRLTAILEEQWVRD